MRTMVGICLAIATCAGVAMTACTQDPVEARPPAYVAYPAKIDSQCREGRARMFDECGDQLALFQQAHARAKTDGKVLLVEYGAEWCIWCHVFDSHINGESGRFRYTYGSPDEPEERYTRTFKEGSEWVDAQAAGELRDFVAANFVVVHIELEYSPNGYAVLESSGADTHFPGSVPYIFSVDDAGRFAAKFDHDSVERRRDDTFDWYRGYDRRGLLKQLAVMRDAAQAQPETRSP